MTRITNEQITTNGVFEPAIEHTQFQSIEIVDPLSFECYPGCFPPITTRNALSSLA